jgi:uncharacterized protein (DUF362 family)
MTVVGTSRADYSNLDGGILDAVERAGGIQGKADKICIKINLCDCRTPETGAVTDPRFLESFLTYLQDNVKPEQIFVVESNATSVRPNLIMRWLGFDKILSRFNASWVNLSETSTRVVELSGRHFKKLDAPELLLDSYLVSLAKLKTHMLTTISCGLKNIYGCLPYPRKIVFHPFIDDAIVDANLALRPRFSLVDGVIAHVGTQGPAFGIPVRANLIIAGTDPVSVDATCCRALKFIPFLVGHVRKAHFSGVGNIRPNVNGVDVKDMAISPEYGTFEKLAFSVARRLRRSKSGARATEV